MAVEGSMAPPPPPLESMPNDIEDKNIWIEQRDPASGRVYYYNSDTGETSWTKPTNGTVDGVPV